LPKRARALPIRSTLAVAFVARLGAPASPQASERWRLAAVVEAKTAESSDG
jgi:hypothetical protein